MQVLARLLIVLVTTLASLSSHAQPSEDDFDAIRRELEKYALELRDIGKAMKAHARTEIPEALDEDRKKILVAKRLELEEAGDAALKLAHQVERRGRKARRRALTRADMQSLGVESDLLARRVDEKLPKVRSAQPRAAAALDRRLVEVEPVPKAAQDVKRAEPMPATGLNETIKEVEAMQETVRNKRQQAVTAFQNFDQKWNQLFNMLTTVLKNKKDMDAGTTRNML